ncbi:alpha/beta hydrolase [Spirosoma aureum]|uniref:Alpha/beta hydrolase n=1 Tax=Spirosoma aureum TaxID=2692134 RepID=A0A6G9AY16_9BACT|nr:alpha/beta hydrolase [Spirosoma aureum]QIP17352.1 alpha/beta hydrolase [Spirosoma aureum]
MIQLNEGRLGFESLGTLYPPANNIRRADITLAGVACSWFFPVNAPDHEIIFFIHGGGFIFGSINSHAALVSHLAQYLNRKILLIEYRLAPENPFPAGLQDCVAVIRTFCDRYPTVNVGLIGDSAGGNLAMATQLVLQQTKRSLPHYSILISPWVDLRCQLPSYTRNKALDTILSGEFLLEAAQLYAPSALDNPLASPVLGLFSGLSSVLILCGTHEILEDDSIRLHKRLIQAGVEAQLQLFPGEQHVWPFLDIATRGAQEALAQMGRFVTKNAANNALKLE